MSHSLTRRDFLGDAAKAGVVSALKLDISALPKSPMPAQPDRKSNFDAQWRFSKGDAEGAQAPDFNDSSWRTLNLPHDWSIEGPFSEDAPAAGTGAYLPTGIGWYRKQFTLPPASRGKRVVLQFDGVYQRSEVWINGTSLGVRPYGFITFSYDLTPHLNEGRQNHLAVRVDNSLQPNCRWYTGSGIYRHTWLVMTDPIHIAPWGTCVRTPSISSDSADVKVTPRVLNEGERNADCDLLIELIDPDGNVVRRDSASHVIPRGSEAVFAQLVKVASPSLWSIDDAKLYTVRNTLRFRGIELDRETTTFGIRQIEFDADKGFLLNTRRIKLNGVCI